MNSGLGVRRLPLGSQKALAAFLGLGGFLGLGLALDAAPRGATPAQWGVWLFLIALVGFAIVAAVLLWRNAPLGLPFAMWAFLLQLPYFEANGFTYSFYTTASVTAVFRSSAELGLEAAWGTSAQLHLAGTVDTTVIGINLVAVFALVTLSRISKRAAALIREPLDTPTAGIHAG